jgi:hypothetical protein
LAQHQGFDRANRVEQVLRCRPGIGTRLRRRRGDRRPVFARTFAETLNPDYFNRISMGSDDKAFDFALAQILSGITGLSGSSEIIKAVDVAYDESVSDRAGTVVGEETSILVIGYPRLGKSSWNDHGQRAFLRVIDTLLRCTIFSRRMSGLGQIRPSALVAVMAGLVEKAASPTGQAASPLSQLRILPGHTRMLKSW